jgi:predicted dehydrogenase
LKNNLKVAVVGVGHLGQHHARVYHEMEDVELVAVADTDETRGREIAAKWGAAWVASVRELPDGLDAVNIVTPTEDHLESARIALERGWHLLVEKPIARTVEEAEEMVALGYKHQRRIQVGHIERFNSAVIELRKYLRDPLFVESHRLGPPAPRVKDIGVVKDLMIHDLDLVLSLVNSEVESVEAVGVPVLTRFEDIANARIRFKNGCIANLTVSRVSPEQMRKIRFFQSAAYLSLDYQQQQLQVYRKVESPMGGMPSIDRKIIQMEKSDALTRELTAFLDSIRVNTLPPVTGEDGNLPIEPASGKTSLMAWKCPHPFLIEGKTC